MTNLLAELKSHKEIYQNQYHTRKIAEIKQQMLDKAKHGIDWIGVEFDLDQGSTGPIIEYFISEGVDVRIYSASSNCLIYTFVWE